MFGLDFFKGPKNLINDVIEKQKNRKEMIELEHWKTHVRALCRLIDREIYHLNEAYFPVLWDKKISVKQEKSIGLRLLLKAKNLEELRDIATTLNKQNHVVQGWTSRTKELVIAIIESKRPLQLDDFDSSGLKRKMNDFLSKFS